MRGNRRTGACLRDIVWSCTIVSIEAFERRSVLYVRCFARGRILTHGSVNRFPQYNPPSSLNALRWSTAVLYLGFHRLTRCKIMCMCVCNAGSVSGEACTRRIYLRFLCSQTKKSENTHVSLSLLFLLTRASERNLFTKTFYQRCKQRNHSNSPMQYTLNSWRD